MRWSIDLDDEPGVVAEEVGIVFADRRLPPSKWPLARGADLVLFEGWFQKVPPQRSR